MGNPCKIRFRIQFQLQEQKVPFSREGGGGGEQLMALKMNIL